MALVRASQEGQAGGWPFAVRRLGVLMGPAENDPLEAEGVTNPACARGPDGELYLFPRLIAAGNYSRIGIARVKFDADGNPAGVERLGVALEPEEAFEKNPFSHGGCEDPRITYLAPFRSYVMTYTAFSADGPRIAMASSRDLRTWERHGLVNFNPTGPIDFNNTDNKDAVLFPTVLRDPHDGVPSIALVHRPLIPSQPSRVMTVMRPRAPVNPTVDGPGDVPVRQARMHHQSIWISYCNRPRELGQLVNLHSHHRLMSPRASWERAKIGAGTPPVLTRLGWLMIYHGIAGRSPGARYLHYAAGVILLDGQHPERLLYRSPHPILDPHDEPDAPPARRIVFPTAADQRLDLGDPDRFDVYYGIADSSIGVASLRLPETLPELEEPPDELAEPDPAPRRLGHG